MTREEIIPADIRGIIVETASGQKVKGDAKSWTWEYPVILNIKVIIHEDSNIPSEKHYKLYCGIKSNGIFVSDGFKFTSQNTYCKELRNPCPMSAMTNFSDGTIAFRVIISKSGDYVITVGNSRESEDASKKIKVVEEYISKKKL